MKRFVTGIMLFSLLLMLALPVLAAEEPLKVYDIQVKAGETVYVAVELTQPTTGNAMGIQYSYDADLLEPIPASCRWEQDAVLQDFNQDNAGVWTVKAPVDLQGTVCVLAFRVIAEAYFADSLVTCKLTVKNTQQEVGVYEASGKVSYSCEHSYAEQWEAAGMTGHSKTCQLCSAVMLQSHDWVRGDTTPDPDDPTVQNTAYICAVCKMQTSITTPTDGKPADPEVPELPGVELEPGTSIVPPAERPDQSWDMPRPPATEPSGGLPQTDHEQHGPEEETKIPVGTGDVQTLPHNHEHGTEPDTEPEDDSAAFGALWFVLAAIVVLGVVLLLTLRGSNRKTEK